MQESSTLEPGFCSTPVTARRTCGVKVTFVPAAQLILTLTPTQIIRNRSPCSWLITPCKRTSQSMVSTKKAT